ncbi:MAG: phenylacetate--CoA ligase family protein [Eubacteriales bacterium]|nr:phenylacetate--CoA ligase family protein [Eubacteriales bacterium]
MRTIKLLWELYSMKRNLRKSREQIRALQEKKLQKLLRYTYQNSEYYRRKFEAAGITEENLASMPLSAFPAIEKKEFLEHFDALVTERELKQEELRRFDARASMEQKTFLGRYHLVHSSGSTGKPAYFVYGERAWEQMLAGMIRGALWGMSVGQMVRFLLSGPRIAYLAATDGRYGGAMAVGDGVEGMNARQLFLDIKTPLEEWVRQIREFQPNMIVGYPSAIKILGELVHRGEVELDVQRIVSCGEPLVACLRQYLEQTFQAEVVNFYGASESLSLGAELTGEDGMYLFDDMNIIEAKEGELYLTCLYNYVQPLIRYRISDRLTLWPAAETQTYPFTRAERIQGRNEDLLWFESGEGKREFLHPLAIEGFCIEGLVDYQFRQVGKDAFEMLTEVPEPGKQDHVRKEMLRQMKRILREKRLEYVQFYVRFVQEIRPDTRTGKKKLIVA